MVESKRINISFSVARMFAAISIISAHVSITDSPLIDKLINSIGSIGVVVFIILSGYYYKTEKFSSLFEVLKSKMKSIVIPWVVMGTLTFLIYCIPARECSINGWIMWILGNRTYLYYLTVLMICYVIFYRQSIKYLYLSIAITFISVYFTAFGFHDGLINILHITNYLNIFNWIG